MHLTRSLPPQFLLPAWNAHQLALVQRAWNSTDSKKLIPVYHGRWKERGMFKLKLNREKQWAKLSNFKDAIPNKAEDVDSEAIEVDSSREVKIQDGSSKRGPLHNYSSSLSGYEDEGRTGIKGNNQHLQTVRAYERIPSLRKDEQLAEPSPSQSPSPAKARRRNPTKQKRKQKKKLKDDEPKGEKPRPTQRTPLSLFDELFPEEIHTKSPEQRWAEQRLEKLPAFNWDPKVDTGSHTRNEKKERPDQTPRQDLRDIPKLPSKYTPVTNLHKLREDMRQTMAEDEQISKSGPSVLVLSACSKNLEESDFFRISPKGEHIEGWKSGLLKVIPSRDNKTFEPLGSYFLLFSSDAAARAYLDQTMRLHTLTKLERTRKEARFPLPPGYLKEGENLDNLLKGFSLVPGFAKLSLKMLNRPYSARVRTLIEEGGPVAKAAKEVNSQNMVMFSIDHGRLTHYDVTDMLSADGKRRNMHWALARDRRNSVIRLRDHQKLPEETSRRSGKYGATPRTYNGPEQFLISFKDAQEARRFVREWHCRPLPIQRERRAEDEPPPIVNAEILW